MDQKLAAIAQSTSALSIKDVPLNIHVVHEAQYDSADTANGPKCLASTRFSIRQEILTWANSTEGPNIFRLNGPAGTGKSTIARTIADTLVREERLAGGYFFKRGKKGRNGMSRVFSTLVVQIVTHIEGLKTCVSESLGFLDKDALETKSLEVQFKLLFMTPLQKLQVVTASQEVQTLIIDALDESAEQYYAFALLEQLHKHSHTCPRFNILITSRATTQLEVQFEELAELGAEYSILRLQEGFLEETKQDMENYVNTTFGQIPKRRRIKRDPWPDEHDIQTIISRATHPSPLFVYASSLFRFIVASTKALEIAFSQEHKQ